VAYAHSYVHSPQAAEVMLREYSAAAIKSELNGQFMLSIKGRHLRSPLQKGWNRLLVKVASSGSRGAEGPKKDAWSQPLSSRTYIERCCSVVREQEYAG